MTAITFLLPSPPEGWNATTEIVSPMSGWPYQRTIQPAGRGFLTLLKKMNGEFKDEEEEEEEEEEKLEEDKEDGDLREKLSHKHKHVSGKPTDDYYELLGLGHLRWRATNEDLKQAYRQMILIYHPDKMKAADKTHNTSNDEIFKKIQKAYDHLSDLKKRRAYDSTEDFDDAVPSESAAKKNDFFKLFNPVFERNAQWSLIQPAPRLGDLETKYEEVKKFYNFWWDFKSWRDFAIEDEFDLEQAESREEKRWMELQNEKQKSAAKKEERTRLLRLAELAYKYDPRIRKHDEEIEAGKRKKKEAVQEAKRKKEEEAERLIEQEKKQQEEENKKKADVAAEKKKIKAREQKFLQKQRTRLRTVCKQLAPAPRDEEVEFIIGRFSAIQLADLLRSMQGQPKEKEGEENAEEEEEVESPRGKSGQSNNTINREPFDALMVQYRRELMPPQVSPRNSRNDAFYSRGNKDKSADKTWTDDELSNLAKGLTKYPGGVANRWDMIAELLPGRSTRDIATKVKELKASQTYATKASATQKDPFEKLKSKVGDKTIASPLSQRTEDVWEEQSATPANPETATPAATASSTPASTPAPATASIPAPAADGASDVQNWSADEQKALEGGLQTFPNGIADRWERISEVVKTKSKKECIQRYKYLVTMYKGKK